jgi:hypothetical protein
VFLSSLDADKLPRFQVGGKDGRIGTLIALSPATALVKWDGSITVELAGKTITMGLKPETIAPHTEVVAL